MRLSKNLSLQEVTKSNTALRQGINNNPTADHQINLITLANRIFQPIREHFKAPIFISSGYRSHALNKDLGGSIPSQHSKGQALDLDNDAVAGNLYKAPSKEGSDPIYYPSNQEIFDYIRKNCTFDQLIFEFPNEKGEPSWVHVSYIDPAKEGRPNRFEILVAKKNSKRQTYYEHFKK